MHKYRVQRQSKRAESGSGGKDYHLLMIECVETKNVLFVTRWGKAGQFGTGWNVERHTIKSEADKAWKAKVNEKFNRAYTEDILPFTIKQCADKDELYKVIGTQIWHKLGKHLSWLDPDNIDDMESKEAWNPDVWDDDEKRYRKAESATAKAKMVPEEPSVEEQVKENPQWGSW